MSYPETMQSTNYKLPGVKKIDKYGKGLYNWSGKLADPSKKEL
jgi:hypothetical protein